MIYSNPEFLVFFVIVFSIYLFLKSDKQKVIWLSAASLFFYAWAGFVDTIIFMLVVVFSWLFVYLAKKFPAWKKQSIAIGITLLALHLFFWKYATWTVYQVQRIYPEFLGGAKINLPLPIGISFFTLQGIAYLVDYARDEARFISFPRFLLFKSFFPQLIAGPIMRAHELFPQILKPPRINMEKISLGVMLFCSGLMKKLLIADRISVLIDPVFDSPHSYGRGTLVFALLGYTVQIWADFSGYTDMGRGIGRILGFQMPENFLSPYLSRSPSEFWRRWHITLSQWIRDYIYIPLGGGRGGLFKVGVTAFVTMVISGFWHGANWNFLLWGFYHGFLLVVERVGKKLKITASFANQKWWQITSWALMLCSIVFGWLLFRCFGLRAIIDYCSSFYGGLGTGSVPAPFYSTILFSLLFCFAFQAVFYFDFQKQCYRFLDGMYAYCLKKPRHYGVFLGGASAAAVVASVVFRFFAQGKAFIYFQF